MQRYVIIGSGPAGVAAAETIRSSDPLGEIILISAEPQGYYSRPGLAYYLTGEIPEQGLYPFAPSDFKALNIKRLQSYVSGILPHDHAIQLKDGHTIPYDRLLVAVGARAAQMSAPGMDLNGVVKLDNLNDAQSILRHARKAREAVVIGGGITALELVEGLSARKVRPHYFLRGDRYWSNVLDETESQIIERRLKEENVNLHYHTDLDKVVGKRGKVSGVITKDGEEIQCQMVAIAIGIRPRLELAQAAGLETDRAILVDEYLQTSAEDIYAAGDAAQVFDPITGKAMIESLWGPAKEQGRAAGANMAGVKTSYIKSTPFNVTRLAGLTTTIIGTVGRGNDKDLRGIARGDSEIWRQLPDAIAAQTGFDVNHVRVMIGEDRFIGAIVMGDQTLSQPLHRMIEHKADIRPIREQLLASNGNLPEVLINFWSQWRKS